MGNGMAAEKTKPAGLEHVYGELVEFLKSLTRLANAVTEQIQKEGGK